MVVVSPWCLPTAISFDMLFLQPETVTVDFGLVPVPWEKQHPDLGLLLAKEMLS